MEKTGTHITSSIKLINNALNVSRTPLKNIAKPTIPLRRSPRIFLKNNINPPIMRGVPPTLSLKFILPFTSSSNFHSGSLSCSIKASSLPRRKRRDALNKTRPINRKSTGITRITSSEFSITLFMAKKYTSKE